MGLKEQHILPLAPTIYLNVLLHMCVIKQLRYHILKSTDEINLYIKQANFEHTCPGGKIVKRILSNLVLQVDSTK